MRHAEDLEQRRAGGVVARRPMTLHLHTASRTDLLADGLADLLADPLADPFAEEVVVVPAKGVERWLAQRLSHRLGAGPGRQDGVCAGVRFLNPRSLVALLLGCGEESGSSGDPWDPDRFVWPLLEVVDDCLTESPVPAWATTFARHLGHGEDGELAELRRDRRFSVVRRVAGLFAAYAVQRPTVLADWRDGRDTDGAGALLPDDLTWQAELWRRLVAAVDDDPPDVRHARTLEALRSGGPLALPDRLSMFGHTRMPVTELELLRTLGEVREVHLWLPQPSPAAWQRLAPDLADGPVRRRDDRSGRIVRHPLLSSLGRDSRELQRSLALLGTVRRHPLPEPEQPEGSGRSHQHNRDGRQGQPDRSDPGLRLSRLQRLQHELRGDQPAKVVPPPGSAAPPAYSPDRDPSVQVHASHGPTRQVEVLREVLVGLLEDDPTLEPRDVLVMCPDVEAYAPLFSAAFGLGPGEPGDHERHPAHRLRVRLADRGLLGTNPLLALAGQLVALAGGRSTASEVLDIAASEPVRHRFGWGDDDLATLTGWVGESGVRWGLNPQLRGPYRLDDFGQNTWQAGLDRLLLGAAMAEEEGSFLGPCLPLDDVGSAAVELAGALAELVSRLEGAVVRLRTARSLREWLTAVREGVLDIGSVPPSQSWQRAQLERELAVDSPAVRTGTGSAEGDGDGDGPQLRLADVRTLLELRLQPRPTRANFRTGNLTVATLVPMRSVPHRVVCLVGLDDGVFPRTTVSDGDDVLARDPMTGERDPRSEDRQLLLDAVLAATETLVVTYTGANEHSGQPRPPAVPLGELLDSLDRSEPGARGRVVVEHPLQPFDARNFIPGQLGTAAASPVQTGPVPSSPVQSSPVQPTAGPGAEPFSFDAASLGGALATTAERCPRPVLLEQTFPAYDETDVSLADLRDFLVNPARGFLRQRLDVGVAQAYVEVQDALPVEIDPLESWEVGDRVLRSVLAGADPGSVLLAEQFRGTLPPLRLGERKLAEITERVQGLCVAGADLRGTEARAVDVTVDLGGRRRLTGVVPDVRGDRIVRQHYSNLGAKHRLASWVDLLALAASDPDRSWTAVTLGWHRRTGGPMRSALGPVDHTALDLMRALVDVRDRGLRAPLLIPLDTAHAYADAHRSRSSRGPEVAARSRWETGEGSPVPGEQDDAWHVRLLGRAAPFERLTVPPADGEDWNTERSRLGRYALHLWQPLFAHEQLVQA